MIHVRIHVKRFKMCDFKMLNLLKYARFFGINLHSRMTNKGTRISTRATVYSEKINILIAKKNILIFSLFPHQIYPDPESEKAIMGSLVFCIHHKQGCKWSDELRKLKVSSAMIGKFAKAKQKIEWILISL